MTFGERIEQLRRERGWTKLEFARRLGVHDRHISRWEKGKNRPMGRTLEKMAEVFGVTADELFGQMIRRRTRCRISAYCNSSGKSRTCPNRNGLPSASCWTPSSRRNAWSRYSDQPCRLPRSPKRLTLDGKGGRRFVSRREQRKCLWWTSSDQAPGDGGMRIQGLRVMGWKTT